MEKTEKQRFGDSTSSISQEGAEQKTASLQHLTNFDEDQRPVYEEAIRVYRTLFGYGGHRAWPREKHTYVIGEPNGGYRGLLGLYVDLHGGPRDASNFWFVFDVIRAAAIAKVTGVA